MDQFAKETIDARVSLVRKGGMALAIILGIFGGYLRYGAVADARHMLANGVAAEAVVVDKKHWVETGRKNREYDRYALVYEFKTEGGQVAAKELRVAEESFTATTQGQTLSILYRADDPSVSDTRMHYEHTASLTNGFKAIGTIVLIVLGVTFLIGFALRRKMEKQMAAQTTAA